LCPLKTQHSQRFDHKETLKFEPMLLPAAPAESNSDGAEKIPMINARHHVFYGEASTFTAQVESAAGALQIIREQAFQRLSPYGGNQTSPPTPFSQPGIVSMVSGQTTVTGTTDAEGWTTSVKSVVDTLNIAGVVTADEITAHVTTHYPLVGYVPSVSFQGTEFKNLRVNGNPVTPTLNLGMCTPQPAGDAPYVSDPGLLARAQTQYTAIAGSGAPAGIKTQFQWSAGAVQRRGKVDCSLVTGVAGLPPTQAFGHILVVPNFGIIYLAELAVGNHIELTMIRVELTALGKTELKAVNTESQGHTMP
jgi:hypothetical protein